MYLQIVKQELIECGLCSQGCTDCDLGCESAIDPELRKSGRSKIQEYTFEKVKYRLIKDGAIPEHLVETAINEFRKFLIVVLEATEPIGMISPIVDEVWHNFILHTKDYEEFCLETFGQFVHHKPNTPSDPSNPESIDNFLQGYVDNFGELDPIWMMNKA